MKIYPVNTANAVILEKLYISPTDLNPSERLSTRMVNCASVLPPNGFIGWQMQLPTKGLADISVFGNSDVKVPDLEWMTESCGKFKRSNFLNEYLALSEDSRLYSLSLDVRNFGNTSTLGFTPASADPGNSNNDSGNSWPMHYSTQFVEIIKALRISGGIFRCTIGSADRTGCFKEFISTWRTSSIRAEDYFGKPVNVSLLMILPGEPSIRLRSILDEAVSGIVLKDLGSIHDERSRKIWDNPLSESKAYPNFASRILIMEPVLYKDNSVPGIEFCEKDLPPIFATHENPKCRNALTIGKTIKSSGEKKSVKIDDTGIKMHWDILGASGTGKTSLLTQTIVSAIKTGHGCTVLDPHGNLIDSVLERIPMEYVQKIKVVRIGQADKYPVPVRLFSSDDYRDPKVEMELNNYASMFQAIYDPDHKGYVGPRWIRFYTMLTQASLSLGLGGTFQSILTMVQNQENTKLVLDALAKNHYEQDKEIFDAIRNDFYSNRSDDLNEVISWFLSKFHQLTSTIQLRNTFGATGEANALDFSKTVDTDTVYLIDLSSPIIGNDAARLTGMILLSKLWDAILSRSDRQKNHIIAVDEAHLFSNGSNTLERMICEGRKFGCSLLMAHQNLTQLTLSIREAVSSATNFSCFRSSVKDSVDASMRLDDPAFASKLCRLNNFNAITTLSVNGIQTNPFTLLVSKPKKEKNSSIIAEQIEFNSFLTLVEPYLEMKAMTSKEIIKHLRSIISTRKAPDRTPIQCENPEKMIADTIKSTKRTA